MKPVTVMGYEFRSLRAFAAALGVNHRAVAARREQGWSDERIAKHFGLMPLGLMSRVTGIRRSYPAVGGEPVTAPVQIYEDSIGRDLSAMKSGG